METSIMNTHRFSKFFLILVSTTLITAVMPAFGQDESAEPAAENEAGLTQGQAAVLIARRLGLFKSSSAAPTQASAIQVLSARGVSPKGGWDAVAVLTPGQLARLLVQALGLEQELSEAQIAGDDAQPYIDLLIEKFGVDVSQIGTGAALANAVPRKNKGAGIGPTDGETLTDPLGTPPLTGGDIDNVVPVSQKDLVDALNAIVGGSGGSGNITPSAP